MKLAITVFLVSRGGWGPGAERLGLCRACTGQGARNTEHAARPLPAGRCSLARLLKVDRLQQATHIKFSWPPPVSSADVRRHGVRCARTRRRRHRPPLKRRAAPLRSPLARGQCPPSRRQRSFRLPNRPSPVSVSSVRTCWNRSPRAWIYLNHDGSARSDTVAA